MDGALAVNAPGSAIADGVLHGLDVRRQLPKVLWLPGELSPNRLEPEHNQRLGTAAGLGNFRAGKVLPEAKQKDFDRRGFAQPVAGVQGTGQLKDLGRDAALCLIELGRLGGGVVCVVEILLAAAVNMPTRNWIGKEAVVNHHLQVPFHLLKDVPDLARGDPGSGQPAANAS